MKRRVSAAIVLVVAMVIASSVFVLAAEPSTDVPFAIAFEQSATTDSTVTYNVVLTRFAGSDATASLIDVHLTVTGNYNSATGFTAMNDSGVSAEWDGTAKTLRLYRTDMAHPLDFTNNRIVVGTLTLSDDGNGVAGLAQNTDYATADYVASDGITSPGYQDSLLASVGTATYTFPQGVTVSGQIQSYNPNNATTIKLMQGSTEKYSTTIATASGSGQVTQDFSFATVAAGTYDLVVTKLGHLTYTVTGVVVGSDDLDLTAATGKAYSTMTMLCGDLNGDGRINPSDINVIYQSGNYYKSAAEAADPYTDLNGDLRVNPSDINIIYQAAHYYKGVTDCTFDF